MVETTTLHYGWTKPELQHSPTTWGGFLNTDLDSIDGIVFSNQQGIVPIGALSMWPSATPPANGNWLICDGRSLSRSAPYDQLFAIIGTNFGNVDASHFNLPNLTAQFPLGAGTSNPIGTTGGSFTSTLQVANLPAHNHPAWQDAHVHAASQAAHTHSITQDAHAHTVGNTSAHSHVIVTGNHSHAITTGGHSHTVLVSSGATGGTPAGVGFSGNSTTVSAGNLGGNTDTAGNLGGYTDTQALTVGNTDVRTPAVHCDTQAPAITVDSRTPNVYTGNTGSSTPFNTYPPYLAIYFIIRFQ